MKKIRYSIFKFQFMIMQKIKRSHCKLITRLYLLLLSFININRHNFLIIILHKFHKKWTVTFRFPFAIKSVFMAIHGCWPDLLDRAKGFIRPISDRNLHQSHSERHKEKKLLWVCNPVQIINKLQKFRCNEMLFVIIIGLFNQLMNIDCAPRVLKACNNFWIFLVVGL